jgi:hypothetical protein
MRFVMTADQFAFLKDQATHNEAVTSLTATNATDGELDSHDVLITFHYDGVALNFDVTKKHTLAAKIASPAYIERHIDDIIAEVLSTEATINAAKLVSTEGAN